jgi:hypothetical protein
VHREAPRGLRDEPHARLPFLARRGVGEGDEAFDRRLEARGVVDLDDDLPGGRREERPVDREGHVPAERLGEVGLHPEAVLRLELGELRREVGLAGRDRREEVVDEERGLLHHEGERPGGAGGDEGERSHRRRGGEPAREAVTLGAEGEGRLPARGAGGGVPLHDEVLGVEEARHPERVDGPRIVTGRGSGPGDERLQIDADDEVDSAAVGVGEPRVERPAPERSRRRERSLEAGERRTVDGGRDEIVVNPDEEGVAAAHGLGRVLDDPHARGGVAPGQLGLEERAETGLDDGRQDERSARVARGLRSDADGDLVAEVGAPRPQGVEQALHLGLPLRRTRPLAPPGGEDGIRREARGEGVVEVGDGSRDVRNGGEDDGPVGHRVEEPGRGPARPSGRRRGELLLQPGDLARELEESHPVAAPAELLLEGGLCHGSVRRRLVPPVENLLGPAVVDVDLSLEDGDARAPGPLRHGKDRAGHRDEAVGRLHV